MSKESLSSTWNEKGSSSASVLLQATSSNRPHPFNPIQVLFCSDNEFGRLTVVDLLARVREGTLAVELEEPDELARLGIGSNMKDLRTNVDGQFHCFQTCCEDGRTCLTTAATSLSRVKEINARVPNMNRIASSNADWSISLSKSFSQRLKR